MDIEVFIFSVFYTFAILYNSVYKIKWNINNISSFSVNILQKGTYKLIEAICFSSAYTVFVNVHAGLKFVCLLFWVELEAENYSVYKYIIFYR